MKSNALVEKMVSDVMCWERDRLVEFVQNSYRKKFSQAFFISGVNPSEELKKDSLVFGIK